MDYGIAAEAHMNHGNARGIWTHLSTYSRENIKQQVNFHYAFIT